MTSDLTKLLSDLRSYRGRNHDCSLGWLQVKDNVMARKEFPISCKALQFFSSPVQFHDLNSLRVAVEIVRESGRLGGVASTG